MPLIDINVSAGMYCQNYVYTVIQYNVFKFFFILFSKKIEFLLAALNSRTFGLILLQAHSTQKKSNIGGDIRGEDNNNYDAAIIIIIIIFFLV